MTKTEYNRIWRANNPEKVKAQRHRGYLSSKARGVHQEQCRVWRSKNKAKCRKYTRDYFLRHPDKKREYDKRGRAKSYARVLETNRIWAANHPGLYAARSRNYRRKYPDKVRAMFRKIDQRHRDALSPRYIKNILRRAGIKEPPLWLIELKAKHIQMRRALRIKSSVSRAAKN